MTSIAFLLRLALLLLAPLLIAPAATAQPGSSRATPSGAQIDSDRAVLLDVETEFGETVEVDLLRPAAWLSWHGLSEGTRMPFASPELGIDGIATVVGIGRCPESAAGSEPGKRAVTALFRRTAQTWVTLHLVGQSEPIRCTPEHPIWSKSRQRWVGAGDLEAGEELDAAGDGDEPPSLGAARAVVVERIERHANPAAVFNLEVHRAHTYRVGAGRVLVHNSDDCTHVDGKYDRPEVETKSGTAVTAKQATADWDAFLGSGQTNINPHTGLPDADRIWSADGKRSIRFGDHEMNSAPNRLHYHKETWHADRVENNLQRVQNQH